MRSEQHTRHSRTVIPHKKHDTQKEENPRFRGTSKRGRFARSRLAQCAMACVVLFVACSLSAANAQDETPTFGLLSGHDRGVNKTDNTRGSALPTYDTGVGKDVLECDYTIPQGGSVDVWVKDFPAEVNADTINTVHIGMRLWDVEQVNEITVSLELAGSAGTQRIPLRLKSGWSTELEAIDWETVGSLNEVTFVITPADEKERVQGTISLALDFTYQEVLPTEADTEGPFSFYTLMDAGQRGVFNIGDSQGTALPVFDAERGKEVIEFSYEAPKATYIGVWTQGYPQELGPEEANALEVSIKVESEEQLKQIAVKLEVKGKESKQDIPLELKPGWNTTRELIDWNNIGTLREVVFVVNSLGADPLDPESGPAEGMLYFDLGFGKLSFFEKNSTFVKLGLVVVLAFFGAFLVSFLRKFFRSSRTNGIRKDTAQTSLTQRLKSDLFYGMMVVLMIGVTLKIYYMGMIGSLDAGLNLTFLAVAIVGALIAELWKFKLTGKHLTSGQVFQNILLTGILAAVTSKQVLLHAPATWTQVILKSHVTAALAFFIYHLFNACTLASSGKHIKPVSGSLIVGTPFLFGWLLLIENGNLIAVTVSTLTGGLLHAWPEVIKTLSRIVVVFLFNEALMNGISLATKGKLIAEKKSHMVNLFVSLAVILAPHIADFGSLAAVGALPIALRSIVVVLATMLSYAGLWGEVYLITGMTLDWTYRYAPTGEAVSRHVSTGMKKGAAYSGILMALLYLTAMFLGSSAVQNIMAAIPFVIGIAVGAGIFPLIKTIIETFDGSQPFLARMRYSYKNWVLYLRGAIVGYGFTYMVTSGMFEAAMPERIKFGLMVGLAASIGVSILRDVIYQSRNQGKLQSWRLYFIDAILGAFVGSAGAFYLDAAQVPVVIAKFKQYTSAGFAPLEYPTYPLVNKWGYINLGTYTGGAKLIFTESLAGVINWSVAAWLFAVNKVFMEACFKRDKSPIKFFFSKAGFVDLMKHMIFVLRWGLWMSPIIFTFLRMMPEPTWYNQDGAIRTLICIYQNATLSPEAFRQWSLGVFVGLLTFDLLRVLIWMDHMGLRVATLVNLSFIGMDKLDEKIAKFIGPAAAQRYIPEAVKRFTTWGPLLIPFYLPRGADWDYAWTTSEAMQHVKGGGLLGKIQSFSLPEFLLACGVAILGCTVISYFVRLMRERSAKRQEHIHHLGNRAYTVNVKEDGGIYSQVVSSGFDVSRRTYDIIDPCGRALYIVDTARGTSGKGHYWPVIGNFPKDRFEASTIEKKEDALQVINATEGVRTTVDITLPDEDTPAELWTITLENTTNELREVKVVPYLEWVISNALDDRFHTQYTRLFPVMEYVAEAHAVLGCHKKTKVMGFLASDIAPEGYQNSRMDFIGRAQSIWEPRVLETLDFLEPKRGDSYPTFDPIGSLIVGATLEPNSSQTVRILMGAVKNKEEAVSVIKKYLTIQESPGAPRSEKKKRKLLIGHGEILPGTPQPYYSYREDGNKLVVHTPYTPRPYDHPMSNALGHSVMVTNRGLHTSCNGNSQQNRLTPDWADTVTKEIPSEAIYLYDERNDEWFSPTLHPVNDHDAGYESEFGVDGSAVFRMKKKDIATELTVFVPPHEPTGVYLLKVKNTGPETRHVRVAPYFQIVLALQPDVAGPLTTRFERETSALYFRNPRNLFRKGWAFASMSLQAAHVETTRGKFFGRGRGVDRPYVVEKGSPDETALVDDRAIAAFVGSIDIAPGDEQTIVIVLGQTNKKKEAQELVRKYKNVETAQKSLNETRQWWLALMETVKVKTDRSEANYLLNWLKYQALAERIWARRGFYQTSGAFGFRDQLQDTVNLMWVDPALARKQILLHASHQFIEGDVFHWFFTRVDGRTSFACRSHASDNLLWLVWGVVEYLKSTSDETLLDELTYYVKSENPFLPLPHNKGGWGDFYQRSFRADTVYRHCMRSIDLVLNKRMGIHGLPLIGTGDWNDGLDEIGSEGRGESVWLGFFLLYILKYMVGVIEKKDGADRRKYYEEKMKALTAALEWSWRDDRYLRAIHDDGTEIGIKDSGIWETDALTAAWAVMAGINPEREVIVFHTALRVLERENVILLGWPALREDSKPYLGRSSKYPEGVRENGMYCHGDQWMIRAARILAERFDAQGDKKKAAEYREIAYRLWNKITPLYHMRKDEIEIYGGQPNKQAADMLTVFEPGRMIWNGYTGAAGWLLKQAYEGVIGASLVRNELVVPEDLDKPRGDLRVASIERDVNKSPLKSVLG